MAKEYKKNYISNFLIRLDLESKLDDGDYDKLFSLLSSDYPINEKRNIQNRNIIFNTIDGESVAPVFSDPEFKVQYILYNTKKTSRITINSDSVLYESLYYTSYSNVKPILEKIINCLNREYGIKNFNRIGLRYVNLIKMPLKDKKQIFDWDGYINNSILFDNSFIDENNLLQEIRTIDFKLDPDNNILCRLQTGIPNRNMPADLMEKIYLIDIDGFTNTMIEHVDAMDILNIIHDKNIEIFEKCIGDALRGDMDE